jgi:hypothetical protein
MSIRFGVFVISQKGRFSEMSIWANDEVPQNKRKNRLTKNILNGFRRIELLALLLVVNEAPYLLIISIVSKCDSLTQLFSEVG